MEFTIKDLEGRIELLEDEIHRIQRALNCIKNGEPFEIAVPEEVFLEEKANERQSIFGIASVIRLAVLYKNKIFNKDYVEKQFYEATSMIMGTSLIGSELQDNRMVAFMEANLADAYEYGINMAKKHIEAHYEIFHLKDVWIPEICRWPLSIVSGDFYTIMLECEKDDNTGWKLIHLDV